MRCSVFAVHVPAGSRMEDPADERGEEKDGAARGPPSDPEERHGEYGVQGWRLPGETQG